MAKCRKGACQICDKQREIERTRAIARQLIEVISIVDHRTGLSEERTKAHTATLEALIDGTGWPKPLPWE